MEDKSYSVSYPDEPISYWISSTDDTNYPVLNDDITVDIAIVGGGISGITAAYLLKNEGLKVAVIEADMILHGTTGHTTAKVTSQHGIIYSNIKNSLGNEMAKQYSSANENAIKVIEDLVAKNNIDCDFEHESSYVYTQDDKYIKQIQDEASTAADLGIKASYIEECPLPFKIKAAVRFDDQAKFHPLKYLLALSKNIPGDGSYIFEQTRAVDIEKHDKLAVVCENGKKVTAKKIIIASHYPFYNFEGFYFARIYPERSYVLGVKIKNKYPGGMYISAEDPGRSLRSQKYDGGELVLVSGEHHKTGQGPEMMTHYEALRDFAVSTFDVESIPFRWSTQDCMTLDGIPYAGMFSSNTPNIYLSTGYGKWGMTNSTASAVILKDLIVKGHSPWQDVYSPTRKTIAESAKTFIMQNANVAGQLVSGKLSSADTDSSKDMAVNEVRIVNAGGQKIGAYLDFEGDLHVVDTTCTHLGCELKWNDGDRTWDCPCHGSRFTYEGDVVEGPALKHLDNGQE